MSEDTPISASNTEKQDRESLSVLSPNITPNKTWTPKPKSTNQVKSAERPFIVAVSGFDLLTVLDLWWTKFRHVDCGQSNES